jgi:hypothetical protein
MHYLKEALQLGCPTKPFPPSNLQPYKEKIMFITYLLAKYYKNDENNLQYFMKKF